MLLQPLTTTDHAQLKEWMREYWGAEYVVGHDEVLDPTTMPGYAAVKDGQWIGLISYCVRNKSCEIVVINTLDQGQGVGTLLIRQVLRDAQAQGCARVWLVTTNDNLPALGFYQKHGFRLVAVHRNAVDRARAIKPSIPLTGFNNIPLHDEIELEYRFAEDL